ncbi:MAG: isoamylase early set domain-containing protein [Anaerolineae bacterium]|nr:isoamylase early set domain-containing protein [Anaerolineae bacterium]
MLNKRFLKSGTVKVEFILPEAIAAEADSVFLVGDFNDWSETTTPMKKFKNGKFKITLDLELNGDFQFRYLVDGAQWHNDWDADRYVANPFSGDNSVVNTTPPEDE